MKTAVSPKVAEARALLLAVKWNRVQKAESILDALARTWYTTTRDEEARTSVSEKKEESLRLLVKRLYNHAVQAAFVLCVQHKILTQQAQIPVARAAQASSSGTLSQMPFTLFALCPTSSQRREILKSMLDLPLFEKRQIDMTALYSCEDEFHLFLYNSGLQEGIAQARIDSASEITRNEFELNNLAKRTRWEYERGVVTPFLEQLSPPNITKAFLRDGHEIKWDDLFIWAALVGNKELANDMWERCNFPIHAALLASTLCANLSGVAVPRAREALLRRAQEYEELAIHVLDMCESSINADKFINQPTSIFEGSLVTFALRLQRKAFLSHRFCEAVIEDMWSGKRRKFHASLPALCFSYSPPGPKDTKKSSSAKKAKSAITFVDVAGALVNLLQNKRKQEQMLTFETSRSGRTPTSTPSGSPELKSPNGMFGQTLIGLVMSPTQTEDATQVPSSLMAVVARLKSLVLRLANFLATPMVKWELHLLSMLLFLGIYTFVLFHVFSVRQIEDVAPYLPPISNAEILLSVWAFGFMCNSLQCHRKKKKMELTVNVGLERLIIFGEIVLVVAMMVRLSDYFLSMDAFAGSELRTQAYIVYIYMISCDIVLVALRCAHGACDPCGPVAALPSYPTCLYVPFRVDQT